MTKKQKPTPSNLSTTSTDLSQTVKNLLQSQRTNSQQLSSLRHRRRDLLSSHENRLNSYESSYLLQYETLSSKISDLRASISKEAHTSKLLSASSSSPQRKSLLKKEISSLKEKSSSILKSITSLKSSNSSLSEEISFLNKERDSLSSTLLSLKEEISLLKKENNSIESEKEGLSSLLLQSEDKFSSLSLKLNSLRSNSSLSSKNYLNNRRRTIEDLEVKFGRRRLEEERERLVSKYERKLKEVLQRSREKYLESGRELKLKKESTLKTMRKIAEEFFLKENRIKELKEELEKENENLILVENEFRSVESINSGNRSSVKEMKGRVKKILSAVKRLLERYYGLSNNLDFLNGEKLGILSTINKAKNILCEENINDTSVNGTITNNMSEFNGETEGEESCAEDGMMEESLFPELVEDLERKNLKVEGWGFGRKITVRNMGGNSIAIGKGCRIEVRKGKKGFVVEEEFELGPGEFFLIRRRSRDEGRLAKKVFELEERCLSEYAVDEIMLVNRGEVVSKSILINDAYYNAICNAGSEDEDMGGRHGDGDNSCTIF